MNNTKETKTMNMMTEITAETDAHKLYIDLMGYRWQEIGIIAEWIRTGAEKNQTAADRFFTELLGIESKEAYLTFRDLLKAHLRFFAADQKRLRKLTRQPGGDCAASSKLMSHAQLITKLIEIRRASKAWSWVRAKEAQTNAAA
ncbi:hypothetical protein KUV57_11075 [Epibacterium sp. DP7N7-1]|nr:hypothetical protein [Epibacterium sp. DP7N7-1]